MRTIEQIDQAIDANRNAMLARLHFNPGMSPRQWQAAWDRCPDIQKRERELFLERYDAQCERDRLAKLEERRRLRAEHAAFRKAQREVRSCPTCGARSIAA